MATLVTVENVSKRYENKQALKEVSFSLHAGQVIGLLGHNGAGKSSLINAMLGAHRYEGNIEVCGYHPIHQHAHLMEHLAYISDVNVLPSWMSVKQLLKYTSGTHPSFNLDKALKTLNSTQIQLKSKVGSLSKGMKVQLHLAIVTSTDTKVLILDEPTLGLDLLYRETFYQHLVDWFQRGERALIIASHEVSEIEHLLTDVLILKEGSPVLCDSMVSLADKYFVLDAPNEYSEEMVKWHPLSNKAALGSTRWLLNRDALSTEQKQQLEQIGSVVPASLADIFLALQQGVN